MSNTQRREKLNSPSLNGSEAGPASGRHLGFKASSRRPAVLFFLPQQSGVSCAQFIQPSEVESLFRIMQAELYSERICFLLKCRLVAGSALTALVLCSSKPENQTKTKWLTFGEMALQEEFA